MYYFYWKSKIAFLAWVLCQGASLLAKWKNRSPGIKFKAPREGLKAPPALFHSHFSGGLSFIEAYYEASPFSYFSSLLPDDPNKLPSDKRYKAR